jgi:hypothetical protein
MAIFQNGGAGDVADAGWRLDVGGVVARIVTELLHRRDVNRIGVHGQYVYQRAIGGIADRLFFVGQCSLGGRTAQRATELSAHGAFIVGHPRQLPCIHQQHSQTLRFQHLVRSNPIHSCERQISTPAESGATDQNAKEVSTEPNHRRLAVWVAQGYLF